MTGGCGRRFIVYGSEKSRGLEIYVTRTCDPNHSFGLDSEIGSAKLESLRV